MIGSFWALVPAIVAITLALISKEVYSSLFIGIIMGGIFYAVDAGSGFSGFLTHVFNDGLISSIASPSNIGILIFLVILGIIVCIMNRSGGAKAFGNWAKKHIKTKTGTQIAAICLGILIFIDDYFNCLTVGSVMRPLTDRSKISREKLAYLIDSTAAPVCIIAPISSWAAAVSAFVTEGENGLSLFISAIPYNFYALFTLLMMFMLVGLKFEYGPMKRFETAKEFIEEKSMDEKENEDKGSIIDLIIPIVSLIVMCTLGMIYSGGFFSKTAADENGTIGPNAAYLNFIEAFANSDASVGLVIGSFAALLITVVLIRIRRTLSYTDCMGCITEGFKAMVPAILILCLAWTLKSMTDSLGAKYFVAGVVGNSASKMMGFLPAIIFIVSAFLAFATGTSWGTFGILIPICIAVFPETTNELRIISISACMAGAVCGDHVSPISDTTIMASAGAQCNHVDHVSTQLPYALTCAAVSFVTYIFAGFIKNAAVSLLFGAILLTATIFTIKVLEERKAVK